MERIKILQVIGSLRMGGAETVVLNYFKYINKQRFEFDFLVYGDEIGSLEEEVLNLNGRIIRIPHPNNRYYKFKKNVENVLSEYGPYDIVHSHPLFNSGLILNAAYNQKVPKRIAHAHSARFNQDKAVARRLYVGYMRRKINKYATNYYACSRDAGNYLVGEKQFQKKGHLINNGIKSQEYVYKKNIRNDMRTEFGLNGKFVVGHIGRLCEVKNQNFILDIFRKVKLHHNNSVLMLIGEGNIKEQLREKAKKLNIENSVMFVGERTDVNYLLQGLDVFLFPSLYEGLGIAVIEAQAAGLPCIISDVITKEVDITDLVERVSLEEDESKWAEKVLTLLNGYDRRDSSKEIKESGYDMLDTIHKIESLYSN